MNKCNRRGMTRINARRDEGDVAEAVALAPRITKATKSTNTLTVPPGADMPAGSSRRARPGVVMPQRPQSPLALWVTVLLAQ